MSHQDNVTKGNLRTPRAAAMAGIIFSIMLFLAFWLLRVSTGPSGSNARLDEHAKAITVALSLIPFSGIAFLWLIGVLRDRLGQREDRLLATVFLGSGLLFLSMLFSAAAVASAALTMYSSAQEPDLRMLAFAQTLVSDLMDIYAVKMAGVFMFSISTIVISTGFAPRYIGFLGYGLALFLLFGNLYVEWSFLVFPVWVLLLSAQVLANDLGRRSDVRSPS